SRARLVRQLITESLGIALAGAAGGLVVAYVGMAMLRQVQFPSDMISPPRLEFDQRTFLVSLGIPVASRLVGGLRPALQTTRVDLSSNLKSTDTGGIARRRLTGRAVLVSLQVALSLVIVTIAVFSVQFFERELKTGPGFRITQMAKVNVDASQAGYSAPEAARFFTRVLEEARALPGARSASVTSAMPLFSFQFVPLLPADQPVPNGQADIPVVWTNSIDDQFFKTMDIPLLAGRIFTGKDDGDAPSVAIVNDTLA